MSQNKEIVVGCIAIQKDCDNGESPIVLITKIDGHKVYHKHKETNYFLYSTASTQMYGRITSINDLEFLQMPTYPECWDCIGCNKIKQPSDCGYDCYKKKELERKLANVT